MVVQSTNRTAWPCAKPLVGPHFSGMGGAFPCCHAGLAGRSCQRAQQPIVRGMECAGRLDQQPSVSLFFLFLQVPFPACAPAPSGTLQYLPPASRLCIVRAPLSPLCHASGRGWSARIQLTSAAGTNPTPSNRNRGDQAGTRERRGKKEPPDRPHAAGTQLRPNYETWPQHQSSPRTRAAKASSRVECRVGVVESRAAWSNKGDTDRLRATNIAATQASRDQA